MTEHEYGSGAGIAAYRLAMALADSGHEVFYMFFSPHMGAQKTSFNKLHVSGNLSSLSRTIFRSLSSLSIIVGRYEFRKNLRSLLNLMEGIKPDIVNLHNIGTALDHRAVSVLANHYPVVWTLHDLFAIKGYSYRFKNRQGQTIETAPISANRIDRSEANSLISSQVRLRFVSPSKWLSRIVGQDLSGRKTIQVIPNGVSKFDFFPEKKNEARAKLKLKNNAFSILFVASRLSYERKNIQVLIEAVNLLARESIEILSVGEVDNEILQRYPMIRNLGANFETSKLRAIYSASDIFVVPSLVDNLPNTMIESLYCGTPVIGADVGGIPEAVVPKLTGWLFDPFEPRDLANILENILEDRSSLEEVSEKCFEWAWKEFSVERQTKEYLTLFETLLS